MIGMPHEAIDLFHQPPDIISLIIISYTIYHYKNKPKYTFDFNCILNKSKNNENLDLQDNKDAQA
jgi:hypothetical protein